jgi:uncharacterized protein YceK
MMKLIVAAALAAVLSGCGNGVSGCEAEERASATKAYQEQQEQVSQSLQERWKARSENDVAPEATDGDDSAETG